ncbi:hypothetical protein AX17_004403 [Amanita inopinata Kibby_2008]|nr:hypothetical protein AX17_004403 [Amanita inopinata Kibby_2008]
MSTFTPSTIVDMSKEKEWPANLGMLDWDSTSIVFTKRSLIEFLKYTGITVDTNFNNINKLPRYAKFGRLTAAADAGESSQSPTESPDSVEDTSFKPSRQVRASTGIHDIFNHDEGDDALSLAPKLNANTVQTQQVPMTDVVEPKASSQAEGETGTTNASSFKPSRRVRTTPGGQSSLANLWATEEEQEEFKPTRRVRQGPGGQDHISNIF